MNRNMEKKRGSRKSNKILLDLSLSSMVMEQTHWARIEQENRRTPALSQRQRRLAFGRVAAHPREEQRREAAAGADVDRRRLALAVDVGDADDVAAPVQRPVAALLVRPQLQLLRSDTRHNTGASEPRDHRAFPLSLLHSSNSSNSIQKPLPSTPSELAASTALPHIGYRIPGSRAIICS